MMDFAEARKNMVDGQILVNDVTDRRILKAMLDIPREIFVPAQNRSLAYMDTSVPLGTGNPVHARKMMAPMVLARLLDLAEIRESDIVLDIGCATGYSTAVLAHIAESVVGLEQDEALGQAATRNLAELGVDNAAIVSGPHRQGYASEGQYDVIILEGKVPEVPQSLFAQLKDAGRLAVILESGPIGQAVLFRRIKDSVSNWPGFDCDAPYLPGFEQEETFSF